MAPSKKPTEYVELVRWFKIKPKYAATYGGTNSGLGKITGLEVGNPLAVQPAFGDGAVVKVRFRVAKDVFEPLGEIEILLDASNVGNAEVLVADLKELKESLER